MTTKDPELPPAAAYPEADMSAMDRRVGGSSLAEGERMGDEGGAENPRPDPTGVPSWPDDDSGQTESTSGRAPDAAPGLEPVGCRAWHRV